MFKGTFSQTLLFHQQQMIFSVNKTTVIQWLAQDHTDYQEVCSRAQSPDLQFSVFSISHIILQNIGTSQMHRILALVYMPVECYKIVNQMKLYKKARYPVGILSPDFPGLSCLCHNLDAAVLSGNLCFRNPNNKYFSCCMLVIQVHICGH